jgi:homocysteine S-methyltransferase
MTLSLKAWLLGLDSCGEINDPPTNTACPEEQDEVSPSSPNTFTSSSYILLLDGGVSTHLEELLRNQSMGSTAATTTTTTFPHRVLWSSSLLLSEEGRQLIQQGHSDWLSAGSDILTTVTYQCHFGTVSHPSPPVVRNDQEMIQLLTWGVQLGRSAIDEYHLQQQKQQHTTTTTAVSSASTTTTIKQRYLVASSGCYGAALADGSEYTGIYPGATLESLRMFHWKKAQVLWDLHPDGLAIETIPSVEECRAVCHMLQDLQRPQQLTLTWHSANGDDSASVSSTAHDTDGACWISLACCNGTQLNNGEPLADAVHAICELDPAAEFVHAIGLNCCDSIHLPSLLQILTTILAVEATKHQQQQQQPPQLVPDNTGKRRRHRGIVIYPNSGEEWDAAQSAWKAHTGCTSSNEFAIRLMEAVQMVEQTWNKYHSTTTSSSSSISSSNTFQTSDGCPPMPQLILWGCCRTSPTTIAALRKLVDGRQGQGPS